MTGYKVVELLNGKRVPMVVTQTGLEFRKDSVTARKPGWGPFGVFDTLIRAARYNYGTLNHSSELWRVEYSPSQEFGLWKLSQAGAVQTASMHPQYPAGTVFADNIKLVHGPITDDEIKEAFNDYQSSV